MKRLLRFLRLPDGRGLLVEAAFWLAVFEISARGIPFRRLARWMGVHMAQTPETLPPHQQETARRIAWAVDAASRRLSYLPWRNRCLAQALTARAMLRRRNIPCTLYLGVAHDGQEGEARLLAHAWLRCGSRILTGRRGMERFTVVSTFADAEKTS